MKTEEFYNNLLQRAFVEINALINGSVKVVMICGSIRGKDGISIGSNIEKIRQAIKEISKQEVVFDQIKYQDTELEDAPHELNLKMGIFYKGLITSGKIAKIYVLPYWEDSEGTKAEIGYAVEAGVLVEYLP